MVNASKSVSGGNGESDDDAPVTRKEFKALKNTLAELVALMKKKD